MIYRDGCIQGPAFCIAFTLTRLSVFCMSAVFTFTVVFNNSYINVNYPYLSQAFVVHVRCGLYCCVKWQLLSLRRPIITCFLLLELVKLQEKDSEPKNYFTIITSIKTLICLLHENR